MNKAWLGWVNMLQVLRQSVWIDNARVGSCTIQIWESLPIKLLLRVIGWHRHWCKLWLRVNICHTLDHRSLSLRSHIKLSRYHLLSTTRLRKSLNRPEYLGLTGLLLPNSQLVLQVIHFISELLELPLIEITLMSGLFELLLQGVVLAFNLFYFFLSMRQLVPQLDKFCL